MNNKKEKEFLEIIQQNYISQIAEILLIALYHPEVLQMDHGQRC